MARYCLATSAAECPDKTALIVVQNEKSPKDAAEQWTYGQLDEAVRRIAAALLDSGLRPGDRLMIRLPNTSSYALLFFGALAAGIVPLPASSQLASGGFCRRSHRDRRRI